MLIIFLLILHGLAAALLAGAISHQVIAVWVSQADEQPTAQSPGFFARLARVNPRVYTNSVVYLYLATLLLGAIIYPEFRVNVRSVFDIEMPAATGGFEIKEHISALGLGLLPAYWYFWSHLPTNGQANVERERRTLTTLLTLIIWADFFIGHILNNLQGLNP